jgi:hypothetical protein
MKSSILDVFPHADLALSGHAFFLLYGEHRRHIPFAQDRMLTVKPCTVQALPAVSAAAARGFFDFLVTILALFVLVAPATMAERNHAWLQPLAALCVVHDPQRQQGPAQGRIPFGRKRMGTDEVLGGREVLGVAAVKGALLREALPGPQP